MRRFVAVGALFLIVGSLLTAAGRTSLARTGPVSKWHRKQGSCVKTMAELRKLIGRDGACLRVLGYHVPGDGGGGEFFWDPASAEADDIATVIVPDSAPASGRWRRLSDDPLSVRWFGAIGDGRSHPIRDYFPTLESARRRYPAVSSLLEQIDGVAIQAALDHLPVDGPSPEGSDGGGVIRIPAGDFRLSTSLRVRADNSAIIGESFGATFLHFDSSTKTVPSQEFSFFRSAHNTLEKTLFRVRVENLTLYAGLDTPGARGLDITGMSYCDFRNLVIWFKGRDSTGVFGTAASGMGPYYNTFTNLHISGPGPEIETNGCRGYWFTSDLTAVESGRAPNANTIRGGRLSSLEIAYDDAGGGNSVFGTTVESVRVAFDLGEDIAETPTHDRPWIAGSTNQTFIGGAYIEGVDTGLMVHRSAAGVVFIPGVLTSFHTAYVDEGTDTTILPGPRDRDKLHGKIGGFVDFEKTASVLNTAPSLTLETQASSYAHEPSVQLNQKHSLDIQIANSSATTQSHALRVYNATDDRDLLYLSGRGDLEAEGGLALKGAITLDSGPKILTGPAAPGAAAPDGSLYLRTDSEPGPRLWVREGGVWIPK